MNWSFWLFGFSCFCSFCICQLWARKEWTRKVRKKPHLFSTFVFSLSSHALMKDKLFSFSTCARATSESTMPIYHTFTKIQTSHGNKINHFNALLSSISPNFSRWETKSRLVAIPLFTSVSWSKRSSLPWRIWNLCKEETFQRLHTWWVSFFFFYQDVMLKSWAKHWGEDSKDKRTMPNRFKQNIVNRYNSCEIVNDVINCTLKVRLQLEIEYVAFLDKSLHKPKIHTQPKVKSPRKDYFLCCD